MNDGARAPWSGAEIVEATVKATVGAMTEAKGFTSERPEDNPASASDR